MERRLVRLGFSRLGSPASVCIAITARAPPHGQGPWSWVLLNLELRVVLIPETRNWENRSL